MGKEDTVSRMNFFEVTWNKNKSIRKARVWSDLGPVNTLRDISTHACALTLLV
jgi:hypothetical protein